MMQESEEGREKSGHRNRETKTQETDARQRRRRTDKKPLKQEDKHLETYCKTTKEEDG